MAQVLKEEIANRIYESACEAFYIHGYKNATVREIANGANIPVGLVYSYYKSKINLFEKIVDPIYSFFVDELNHNNNEKHPKDSKKDTSLFEEMEQLLIILKQYRKQFLILIDKSIGTKYETIKEDIVHMTKLHIEANLKPKLSENNKDMDEFFYHILAHNFMENVFEIARHYKGEKWAKKMLNLLAQQYYYGVNSF